MASVKSWQELSIFDLFQFIYHKVAVYVHDNREFVGWVYTVDPVTQSVVLYLSGQLTTVMGHAISEVNCLEKPNPEMKEMLSRLLDEKPTYEQQWLDRRKSHLAQWLHDNRFPVEVEGERIIVASALDILPPYNINSCHTSNEIILGRVQRLIEAMPQ